MRKSIFILLSALFTANQGMAQNPKLEKEVKSVLMQFIDAGDNNDAAALEKCLNENFRTAVFDAQHGGIKVLDRATYVSFIRDKKFGGYPRTAEIHSIEFIEEGMASVQVTLSSPGKPTLKNFYSLVKEVEGWKVIQDFVVLIPKE